ncbi:MAG TPA: hypothetical protein VMP01_14970 [Pirellulaceae bacterium]|nr:hypothetical protein [Pirellulaceae bacterium]
MALQFTWFGVRKSLSTEQKAQAADAPRACHTPRGRARNQRTPMRLLQSPQFAALRERRPLAHVARSLQRQKLSVELSAQRQQFAEQLFLNDVRRRCLPRCAFDEQPQLGGT